MSASYLSLQADRPVSAQTIETGAPAEKAAVTFVRAMADRDAETAWFYASEEEQDAFATENALFAAYQDTFPAFAGATGVKAERHWEEGDASFVELRFLDAHRDEYSATMGFWLSDAGDWQLISCDVKPVNDRVAMR